MIFAGRGTQSSHVIRCDPARVGDHKRKRTGGCLVDFSDDRFLFFESNSHLANSFCGCSGRWISSDPLGDELPHHLRRPPDGVRY